MKKLFIVPILILSMLFVSCGQSVDYSGTSVEKEEQEIPDGFSKEAYDLSKRVLSIYEKFNNAEITKDEASTKLEGFAETFEKMKEDEYQYTIYLHAKYFFEDESSKNEQEIKDILAGKEYYGITNVGRKCLVSTIIYLEMKKPNESTLTKNKLDSNKEDLELLKKDIAAQEDKHKEDKKYFTRDGSLDLEKEAYTYIKKLHDNKGQDANSILNELNKIEKQADGIIYNGFTNQGYENTENAKTLLSSWLESNKGTIMDNTYQTLFESYSKALESDIQSEEERNKISPGFNSKDGTIDKEKEAYNIISRLAFGLVDDDSLSKLETLLNEAKSNTTETELSIDTPTTAPTAEQTVTPTPDPTPTPKPKKTPKPVPIGCQNALSKAEDYLDYSAFSKKGLIDQLKYEGYSTKEAKYAVNHVKVNWKEQAAKKAKDYMDYSSFSKSGLIDQLKYEGFTDAQARYGAKQVGY